MPPDFTDREILIARIVFRCTLEAIREMTHAGFDVDRLCDVMLTSPKTDELIRESMEAADRALVRGEAAPCPSDLN
jgi:hypothetical protein